jgi:hypothetical protein
VTAAPAPVVVATVIAIDVKQAGHTVFLLVGTKENLGVRSETRE